MLLSLLGLMLKPYTALIKKAGVMLRKHLQSLNAKPLASPACTQARN